MTIIVPTGELVGLFSDAIPFADTDKDGFLLVGVRLWWDGDMLHTEATDRVFWGHASWSPDDRPASQKPEQEGLFDRWGGADDPWSILLPLDDAKSVVTVFKLSAGDWGVPLEVDLDLNRLTIRRRGDSDHSALKQDIDGRHLDDLASYPDVAALIARKLGERAPAGHIAVATKRLAAFGKVRDRGPLRMEFRGEHGMVTVAIGDRFVGAVAPVREEDTPPPAPAATAVREPDPDEVLV